MGDQVYLKVSPMKGVQRFEVKRKLAPRYVGPYSIIKKSGRVAYRVELPFGDKIYLQCFHVSQLKKCLRVPEERVALRNNKLTSDLSCEERPVRVIDTKESNPEPCGQV